MLFLSLSLPNHSGKDEPEAPKGTPPTFVGKPRIVPINDGEKVSLECKVRAVPIPEMLWTFKNRKGVEKEVEEGGRYHLSVSTMDTSLYMLQCLIDVGKLLLKIWKECSLNMSGWQCDIQTPSPWQ